MKQEEAYEAVEGDVISLVYNSDYQYEVTFESSEENNFKPKRPSEEKLVNDSTKRQKSDSDKWDSVDHGKCFVFTSQGVEGSSKIAGFDMDNTLIKTVSGNVFPKNVDDWQLNYGSIPNKLKSLHSNGFKIVVFTNQRGIETGKVTMDELKKKIRMIHNRLEVPCQFFIATGSTEYRKPRTGMWNTLEQKFNDGITIDLNQSFFIGDAAGRPENKLMKRKKDHSCADRLYALNIGLSFYTPEEHFLNSKDQPKNWIKPSFNPSSIKENVSLLEPSTAKLTANEQEIILLVGYPGSGKSYFAQEYLSPKGYEIINRDTLNSAQKCISAIEAAIQRHKSCVIDNTNPDPASRKRFIDEANKHNIPIRCFFFTTTYEHARHNNIFRELTDLSHQKINDMVFNIYKKKFVDPVKKEGFSEIVRVNFVPKFKNEAEEKLYKMYLMEK